MAEYEVVVSPRLAATKAVDAQLKKDLQALSDSISAMANLKITIGVVLEPKAIEKVQSQIEAAMKPLKEFGEIRIGTQAGEFIRSYKELILLVKETTRESEKYKKIFNGLDGSVTVKSHKALATSTKEVVRENEKLKKSLADIETLSAKIGGYLRSNSAIRSDDDLYTQFTDLKKTVDAMPQTGGNLTELRKEFEKLKAQAGEAGLNVKSFGDRLSDTGTKISAYLASILSFGTIIHIFNNAYESVKKIDAAMVELKKVTDVSAATYDKFLTNAAERAYELGAAVSDIVTATADFARLGYSMDEATKLADAAVVYKHVGDGITDISEASKSIISTMRAFGVEAENAMLIVDKFNEVGNNFPISSAGIGDALLRSASSLATAGNTLDESIALVVAANSVIQDEDIAGGALKTISMRLRNTAGQLVELGEDAEGAAVSVTKLQTQLLNLTRGKVDIMADTDTFKSTYQILLDISNVWNDLTDVEQADMTRLVAGTWRGNVFESIMTSMAEAQRVVGVSMDSVGSASRENQKFLEGLEGRLSRLSSSFEALSVSVMDSGIVGFFIDFGRGLLDFFRLADGFPVKTALIVSFFTAVQAVLKSATMKNWGDEIVRTFKDVKNGASGIIAALRDIPEAVRNANALGAVKKTVGNDIFSAFSKNLGSAKQLEARDVDEFAESIGGLSVAQRGAMKWAHGLTNEIAEEILVSKGMTVESAKSAVATIAMGAANGGAIAPTNGLTAAMSGLKAAMSSFLPALLITGGVMLGGWLIGLSDDIKRAREEAVNAVKELRDNFRQTEQETTASISALKSLEDEFAKLSSGVNQYGQNLTLSADEYGRYRDIISQIIDISPQIVQGYDAEGNALINKNEALREAINLQEEYIRSQRREQLSDKNISKRALGAEAEIQQLFSKNYDYTNTNVGLEYSGNFGELFNLASKYNAGTRPLAYKFEWQGFNSQNMADVNAAALSNYEAVVKNASATAEDIASAQKIYSEFLEKQKQIVEAQKQLGDLFVTAAQTNADYAALTDGQQIALNNILNGIQIDVNEGKDKVDDYISGMDKVVAAMQNDAFAAALDSFMNSDWGNLTATEQGALRSGVLAAMPQIVRQILDDDGRNTIDWANGLKGESAAEARRGMITAHPELARSDNAGLDLSVLTGNQMANIAKLPPEISLIGLSVDEIISKWKEWDAEVARTKASAKFEELKSELSEVVSPLSSAISEQNKNGALSFATYSALIGKGTEYADLLAIENGLYALNVESAQKLIDAKIQEAVASGIAASATQAEIERLIAMGGAAEQASSAAEKLAQANTAYTTLQTAMESYNESGSVGVDTFNSLMALAPEYIASLDLQSGKIDENRLSLQELAIAAKEEAISKLQDAAANDIAAVAAGNLKNASEFAKQAVADLGDAAETAGSKALSGAGGFTLLAGSAEQMLIASGIDRQVLEERMEMVNIVADQYQNLVDKISGIDISFGGKSSSKSSEKKAVEEYLADIDELYEESRKLEAVQEQMEALNRDYELSDNLEHRLDILRQINAEYENERAALLALNAARDASIAENVDKLQGKGFIVDWDASTDDLFVRNLDHINELTADTREKTNELRKEYETLIGDTTKLADENKKTLGEILDIPKKIKEQNAKIFDEGYAQFDSYKAFNIAQESVGSAERADNEYQLLTRRTLYLRESYDAGLIDYQRYAKEMLAAQEEFFADWQTDKEFRITVMSDVGVGKRAIIEEYREMASVIQTEMDGIVNHESARYQELYSSLRDVKDNIEDTLKSILSDANDAIDGVQGFFDTLKEASEEFSKNNFISVDSFQEIASYGLEYMSYLRGENGQLVINKEAIERVVRAKTKNLAVETALNYVESLGATLLEKNDARLQKLIFDTDAATASTWDLVYSNLALLDLDGAQYVKALENINKLRAISASAIAGIGQETYDEKSARFQDFGEGIVRVLEKERDALDETREALEKQRDVYASVAGAVGDYIDAQIDKLKAENEELDKQLQVEKALEALEKAKNQRTKQIYVEGQGYVWQTDQAAVSEAQENLDKLTAEDSADAKIKALEKLRDKWNDVAKNYQTLRDKDLADQMLGAGWEEAILDGRMDVLDQFDKEYQEMNKDLDEDVEGSVAAQIKNLKKLTDKWQDAIDDISQEGSQYKSNLQGIKNFESANYQDRLVMLQGFVTNVKSEMEKLRAAQEAAQEYSVAYAIPSGTGSNATGGTGSAVSTSNISPETGLPIGKIVNVQPNGKGPPGLSVGDVVSTSGGYYQITAVKPDGTYGAALISDPTKGYAQGGVVDYTGIAQVHGGSGHGAETILSNADTAKLYRFIHDSPDLIKSVFSNIFSSDGLRQMAEKVSEKARNLSGAVTSGAARAVSVTIGNINLPSVRDPEGFAREFNAVLPNLILQELHTR